MKNEELRMKSKKWDKSGTLSWEKVLQLSLERGTCMKICEIKDAVGIDALKFSERPDPPLRHG
jgi:hypothetical protein